MYDDDETVDDLEASVSDEETVKKLDYLMFGQGDDEDISLVDRPPADLEEMEDLDFNQDR